MKHYPVSAKAKAAIFSSFQQMFLFLRGLGMRFCILLLGGVAAVFLEGEVYFLMIFYSFLFFKLLFNTPMCAKHIFSRVNPNIVHSDPQTFEAMRFL